MLPNLLDTPPPYFVARVRVSAGLPLPQGLLYDNPGLPPGGFRVKHLISNIKMARIISIISQLNSFPY